MNDSVVGRPAVEPVPGSVDVYREVAEHSGDPLLLSHRGAIRWISPSIEATLGWTPAEMAATSLEELCLAADRQELDALIRRADGGVQRGVFRLRSRDRGFLWVLVSLTSDGDAEDPALVGSLREINLRVQAEQDLVDMVDQYRILAENSSDVVSRSSRDGRLEWVSDSVTELVGWRPDELTGRMIIEFVHPEDVAGVRRAGEAAREGTPSEFEARVRTKAGDHRWVNVSLKPIYDDAGAVVGRVAGWRDVTARHEAEQRLADSERRLRAVSDSILSPQTLVQAVRAEDGSLLDFTYLEVNQATCDYVSMTRDELVGSRLLASWPGMVASGLMAGLRSVLETGVPLVLNDFRYPNEVLGQVRYYDIGSAQAGADLLSITWSDVTEQHRVARASAQVAERLRAVTESLVDPLVLFSAVRDEAGSIVDFVYEDVNEATCEYLSMGRDELIGTRMLATLPGMAEAGLLDAYAAAVETGEPVRLTGFRYANEVLGLDRRYDISGTRAGDGLLSLTWRDVTDREEAAGRLAASEERYRLLAQNTADVVVHVRGDTIAWISPSVQYALGGTPADWIGRSVTDAVHPDDRPTFAEGAAATASETSVVRRLRMRAADGTYHWVEVHASAYFDAGGGRDGLIASTRIVDSEVAAEAELARMARFDTLTGLLNRGEAVHRLTALATRSRSPGDHVGLLFCDIDRFKDVNDEYGHAAGDAVLRGIASRITGAVRHEDLVARMGGDELLVILQAVHGLEEAVRIAEKVHRATSMPILLPDGRAVTATLTIGATVATPGEDPDAVLARADRALYEGKRSGRNRVVPIPPR